MIRITATHPERGDVTVDLSESGVSVSGDVSEDFQDDIRDVENYFEVEQTFDEVEGMGDNPVQVDEYIPADISEKARRVLEFLSVFDFDVDNGKDVEARKLAEIPEKYTDGTGLSESDFVPNSDVADVIEPVLEFIDQHGLPNPDNQQEGAAYDRNPAIGWVDNRRPCRPTTTA